MIPQGVIDVRNELCRECVDKAGDPCAVCDHGRWGRYEAIGCDDPNREVPTGLGDVVAAVATPIARALGLPCIDPQTKQLRPESGCAKRKAKLNQKFPL